MSIRLWKLPKLFVILSVVCLFFLLLHQDLHQTSRKVADEELYQSYVCCILCIFVLCANVYRYFMCVCVSRHNGLYQKGLKSMLRKCDSIHPDIWHDSPDVYSCKPQMRGGFTMGNGPRSTGCRWLGGWMVLSSYEIFVNRHSQLMRLRHV